VEGLTEINEINDPNELKRRTEQVCNRIIAMGYNPERGYNEDMGLLEKYDKRLQEMDEKDNEIAALINEARYFAGID
jgi:hypothetical protein